MFPIPSEERSIPNKFGRCVFPVERPVPSSHYHAHMSVYQRDTEAAVFHKHPTHVLWSHFSVPDGDWQYYGSRKHVLPSLSETKESKKRCRDGCGPSSPTSLQKLLPSTGEGLAVTRAEVKTLAQRFSESPLKLNVGEMHRLSPDTKLYDQAPRIPLDPSMKSTVNPLTMEGPMTAMDSPTRATGKRMLLSPLSPSPSGSTTLEGSPYGFSGSVDASYSPKGGKRLIYGQPTFDPLGYHRSHGGKYPELAQPSQRETFFAVAQQREERKLDEKRQRCRASPQP